MNIFKTAALKLTSNKNQSIRLQTLEKRVSYLEKLQYASFFGVYNREGALLNRATLTAGDKLIMIDLCNVHAANHAFTMVGYDAMVKRVTDQLRDSDIVIKWGGDEFVIIPNKCSDIAAYMQRLAELLYENGIYAVITAVECSNSLVETVDRADVIISAKKLELEITGQKAHRDAPYECKESYIVYA